ncbi:MAG: hypothetical protein P8163_10245 [Candidatus Thiodiazotropha sp.]
MSCNAITDLITTRDDDKVPRPAVALSTTLVSKDWEHASHQHHKAQLLYSVRGILNCESVQTVALELFYENASGLVTMFCKAVGKPPARYISERMTAGETTAVPGITFSTAAKN